MMRTSSRFLLLLSLILHLARPCAAQETEGKSGCVILPLPESSYSSDLGLQGGAIVDVCWYGDGGVYPDYICKLNAEASTYSKGNRSLHLFFDSKHQLEGIRFSAALSYFGNRTYSFYGFNGASAVYDRNLEGISDDGTGFYLMSRSYFRALGVVQGRFGNSGFGWAGGLTCYDVRTGEARNDGIVDGKASLYRIYCDRGVIPAGEKNGGVHGELKAGFTFDSRDHEDNPSRGTYAELYMVASPDIIQGRNNYLRLVAHCKQFFPLSGDLLVLGWHMAWQGLLAGKVPFYMLQTLQTLNLKNSDPEGLGSTMTVRGTVHCRLLGSGFGWANMELRWNFARFRCLGQYFRLCANPFADAGMVLQGYRLAEQKAAALAEPEWGGKLYSGKDEHLHVSAGAGLHAIINQNFNVGMELGRSFDRGDGPYGLNLGMWYIF